MPGSPNMGDDVRLRAVGEADLELFFEQEHDPETVRHGEHEHIMLVLSEG